MCAGAEGLESSERGHGGITGVRPYGREYLLDKIKAGLDEAQPGLLSDRDAAMFGTMIRRSSVRFGLLAGPGCGDWRTWTTGDKRTCLRIETDLRASHGSGLVGG